MAKVNKPIKSSNKRMKKLKRIEAHIQSVDTVNHLLHMMIWGPVKSGKTTFLGTAPKPIIFAVEEGTMVLRHLDDVQVYPIDKHGNFKTPRWRDAIDFIYYIRYGDHDRESVGIDTINDLARLAIRYINKDEEARDEARAPGTTDPRTYGRLKTLIDEFTEEIEAACIERGLHLIYTCHEKILNEDQAEREGSDYAPDLIPSIRSSIIKSPSIIARTFKEEIETDDLEADPELRYGMYFRHPEWPVGERITPKGATKPWLPAVSYKATVPVLIKRINRKAKKNG